VRTVSSVVASDGAVSHVTDDDIFKLVDIEVVTASTSRTELHLNCLREDTATISDEVRRTHLDIDRAWSGSCSTSKASYSIYMYQQRHHLLKLTLYNNILVGYITSHGTALATKVSDGDRVSFR